MDITSTQSGDVIRRARRRLEAAREAARGAASEAARRRLEAADSAFWRVIRWQMRRAQRRMAAIDAALRRAGVRG